MTTIFGALTNDDHEEAFISTTGQQLVFDAVEQYTRERNAELDASLSTFVSGTTEVFKERYKKPAGGYLQKTGPNSQPAATKVVGSWDVAYPLESYTGQIAWNEEEIAYMSAAELSAHIEGINDANRNSMRQAILHRLLDNVQETFTDPIRGDLDIEPLANGDAVTYPPVNGSMTAAAENHYAGSGYIAANIDDTNNPVRTIVADLNHHATLVSGGRNVVIFHNSAQRDQLQSLEGFNEVSDNWVKPGDNVSVPYGIPQNVPGEIHGRTDGGWLSEYEWIPENYLLGIHLDEPAPLKMRVDMAKAVGLGGGLRLVATDNEYPFTKSFWRHRFGIGASNRLNGFAMYLVASSSYTVPSAYT